MSFGIPSLNTNYYPNSTLAQPKLRTPVHLSDNIIPNNPDDDSENQSRVKQAFDTAYNRVFYQSGGIFSSLNIPAPIIYLVIGGLFSTVKYSFREGFQHQAIPRFKKAHEFIDKHTNTKRDIRRESFHEYKDEILPILGRLYLFEHADKDTLPEHIKQQLSPHKDNLSNHLNHLSNQEIIEMTKNISFEDLYDFSADNWWSSKDSPLLAWKEHQAKYGQKNKIYGLIPMELEDVGSRRLAIQGIWKHSTARYIDEVLPQDPGIDKIQHSVLKAANYTIHNYKFIYPMIESALGLLEVTCYGVAGALIVGLISIGPLFTNILFDIVNAWPKGANKIEPIIQEFVAAWKSMGSALKRLGEGNLFAAFTTFGLARTRKLARDTTEDNTTILHRIIKTIKPDSDVTYSVKDVSDSWTAKLGLSEKYKLQNITPTEQVLKANGKWMVKTIWDLSIMGIGTFIITWLSLLYKQRQDTEVLTEPMGLTNTNPDPPPTI